MRTLYHFTLCPLSRKIRIILKEKDLSFSLVQENYWERNDAFLRLNPAGEVPVLVEADGWIVAEHSAIAEFLEETYPQVPLLAKQPHSRAEMRRLMAWFDRIFYNQVTHYLLGEKVIRSYTREGTPQSATIRAAKTNLSYHLEYINFLLSQRKWLAGDMFSLADISAASQLSVLDYLNDIEWNKFERVKNWYALMKSRPSFQPLLKDRAPSFAPPKHYVNPDF